MKKLVLFLVSVLGISAAHPVFSQDNQRVHCILLDKTKSMTGSGGGKNIWADVQNYCYTWIDGIKVPSTIVFFTYAMDLNGPQIFEIRSEDDKYKVKEAVKNVNIDGRHTWIASNLGRAWEYLQKNYPNHDKKVYLITDGIEEEMNSSLDDVVKKYSATRGDYDYLYYVDLNDLAPAEVKEVFDTSEGTGYGKGFLKFYEASPVFQRIGYVLGKTQSLEQYFLVEDKDFSNMKFKVIVDSIAVIGEGINVPNVSVTPGTVSFKDLSREGDKYKYDFNIVFHNNSECPCDIFVKLEGVSSDDSDLKFVPSGFCLNVRNKEKMTVALPKGGWMVR